jgi:hypothetical protein
MARVTVRDGRAAPVESRACVRESRTGALVWRPGRAIVQSDCLYGSRGLEAVVYEPYRHGAFPDGGRGALD